MAENHILNIIARLQDSASKGLISLDKNIGNVKTSLNNLTKAQDTSTSSTNKLAAAHKDLENQVNVTQGNIKRLNNEIKKHTTLMNDASRTDKERAKSFDSLNKAQQDLIQTERNYGIVREKYNKSAIRQMDLNDRLSLSFDRIKEKVRASSNAVEKDRTLWQKFAFTTDENSRSVRKLEQRLARLGRAMLGLGIASVIIFMQSFMSVLTAVVGEVINLAGSLTYAAGALGGVFVGAIAQAIPMLGLFAAAMQRVSVIMQAVTQHNLIAKQAAGEQAQAAEQQATANDAVAEAHRNVAEAQQELTQARKEGRLEIEDLIAAEKEAQLTAQRAALAQRDSKWALQDAIQGGDITGIRSAQLDVKESALGRQNARRDLGRASVAANKARRGGVDSLDSVKAASKALADANRQLADSHEQAAQAASDQSAAENSLKYFLDQLSPAEKELYRTIVKFQEDFKKLFSPITDVIISSLTDAIRKFRGLITDPAIVNGFKKLADGMAGVIDRLSSVFTSDRSKSFWEQMLGEGAKNLKPVEDILVNIWRLFRNIAEAAAPVVHKLLKLIADETERWADASNRTKGLTEFFETGLKHLRAWYGLIKALVEMFAALFGISSKEGIKSVEGYTKRIQDATKYIEKHHEEVREFFKGVRQAFGFIIDTVVSIGGAFVEAFNPKAVEALSKIVDNIIVPGLTEAVKLTGKIAIAFGELSDMEVFGHSVGELLAFAITAKIVTGSVSLLAGLLTGLIGPFRTLAGWAIKITTGLSAISTEIGGISLVSGEGAGGIAALAGRIAAFTGVIGIAIAAIILFKDDIIAGLKDAYEEVRPSLEKFIESFKHLAETIKGLFGKGSILGKVLDYFGDIVRGTFQNIGQILGGFFDALSGFLDLIDDLLHGRWGEIWGDLKHIVGGAIRGVLGFLDMMTQPFEDAAKGLFKVFVGVFKGLGDVLADIFSVAFDKMLGAVSTLIDGVVGAMQAVPDIVSPPGFQSLADELDNVGNDIDTFREDVRGSGDETDKATPKIDKHTKSLNQLAAQQRATTNESDKLNKSTKEGSKEQDDGVGSAQKYGRQIDRLKGNFEGGSKSAKEMAVTIADSTNKVLVGFGADPLKFDIPGVDSVAKAVGKGFDSNTPKKQRGGYFGNPMQRGPDDRYVKVAGGEAILTGHQQQATNMALAYGKAAGVVPFGSLPELFEKDQRTHATAPAFAKGGLVPVPSWIPQYDANTINSAVLPAAEAMVKKFHLQLNDAYGSGHASTEHTQLGTAVDFGPGPTGNWGLVDRAAAYAVKAGFTPVGYDGRFGTEAWEGHGPPPTGDHVHITFLTADEYGGGARALAGDIGAVAGLGAIGSLAKMKIGGKGHIQTALQNMADNLIGAGNKKLRAVGGAAGAIAGGRVPATFKAFNHSYPYDGTEALSPNVVAAIAEWAGLPGRTFEQIAHGESAYQPGAVGHDPGGTTGLGLWQITTGYNDATIAKFGGVKAMLNPILNARAAKLIYDSQGIGAWYGTSFLTDPNAHYQGRAIKPKQLGGMIPQFDQGGVVPGSRGSRQFIMAHGGETILPTHKYQTGGSVPTSAPDVVKDAYSTARHSLLDIAGIQSGDFGKITKALTDLLREGGPFDDLVAGIESLTEYLSTKLAEWTYRVRKGIVGQIRTNVELANAELDNLEEVGKQLDKELELLKGSMNQTKARLREIAKELAKEENKKRRDELKDQRDELRTAVANIRERMQTLNATIAQNLADRYAQQTAIFDAAISRFDQRLSKNDLIRQIQEARNTLADADGEDVDQSNTKGILEARGGILQQEQRRIQKELEKARKAHDKERQRELRNALLENKLAQLENTQAIKDLTETVDTTNEIFDFNTTGWQLFRQAVLNGMGGVLPQYQIPSLASGGIITQSGLVNLHAGEVVTPADQVSGKIDINITEPMEVADPIALSNAIAWQLKQSKVA